MEEPVGIAKLFSTAPHDNLQHNTCVSCGGVLHIGNSCIVTVNIQNNIFLGTLYLAGGTISACCTGLYGAGAGNGNSGDNDSKEPSDGSLFKASFGNNVGRVDCDAGRSSITTFSDRDFPVAVENCTITSSTIPDPCLNGGSISGSFRPCIVDVVGIDTIPFPVFVEAQK